MSDDVLGLAARLAGESLGERPVGRPVDPAVMRGRLDGPIPEDGEDPRKVISEMAAALEPGLVAMPGPRYFGFVTGGSLLCGTAWRGEKAIRFSVSCWSATEADIDRSVAAIRAAT